MSIKKSYTIKYCRIIKDKPLLKRKFWLVTNVSDSLTEFDMTELFGMYSSVVGNNVEVSSYTSSPGVLLYGVYNIWWVSLNITQADAGGRIKAIAKVNTIQHPNENSSITLDLWKRSAMEDQNGAAMNSTNGLMPTNVPTLRIE